MPDATPSPVVEVDRVTVTYGKQHALRDVEVTFGQGAAGLLGPNGAGKSTLLKALLGLIRPDQGSMRVLALDVAKQPLAIRARLGYMPESDAHIPGMNAVTFVAYCGQLAAFTMLALSSLSTSARYVAVLYAGAVLFTDAIFGTLSAVTRSTGSSWLSFRANLAQVGDVVFRMPPRYDTPWVVSFAMIVALIAVSIWVLARRVRGVDVVT